MNIGHMVFPDDYMVRPKPCPKPFFCIKVVGVCGRVGVCECVGVCGRVGVCERVGVGVCGRVGYITFPLVASRPLWRLHMVRLLSARSGRCRLTVALCLRRGRFRCYYNNANCLALSSAVE